MDQHLDNTSNPNIIIFQQISTNLFPEEHLSQIIYSVESDIMMQPFETFNVRHVDQKTITKVLGSYSKYKDNDVKDECPICINNYKINEGIRILPCNHTFHKKCVDKWFKKSSFTCPTCRKDFNKNDNTNNNEENQSEQLREIIRTLLTVINNYVVQT